MELSIGDIVRILWSRKWLILAITLLGAAALFGYTYYFVTPMYTASVSMYVYNDTRQDTGITTGDISVSKSLVDTYIVILQSDTLLSKAIEKLPYDYTTAQLGKMVSASAINSTEAFRISVSSAYPDRAKLIANTIAEVVPEEIIRVVKAGAVEVIDYAKQPTAAEWPVMRNTAIGGLAAAVIISGIVLVNSMFDTMIHNQADITEHYELPVLGVIPSFVPASAAKDSPYSAKGEAESPAEKDEEQEAENSGGKD